MPIFSYWKTHTHTLKKNINHYILQSSSFKKDNNTNEEIIFYSSRSLQRETQILQTTLNKNSTNKKKLIWVAPFHQEISSSLNFKDNNGLVWLSMASFSSTLKATHHLQLCYNEDTWNTFLLNINPTDEFTIEIHPRFQSSKFTSLVQEFIEVSFKTSAKRLKTIQHFNYIWEYNFKCNSENWIRTKSIEKLKEAYHKPDCFILGGSSVDLHINTFKDKYSHIWCADTSISTLLASNIQPSLVFSVDPGHASYEHVSFYEATSRSLTWVLDPLSFPKFYRKYHSIYTYTHSNPLLQSQAIKKKHTFPHLENSTGDVYGLMKSLYEYLFPNEELPKIYGKDNNYAYHYVTHSRGSGYYLYQYAKKINKFFSVEQYFYDLSQKFNHE